MSLEFNFSNVNEISSGLWTANIDPSDLRELSGKKVGNFAKSIVSLINPKFSPSARVLSVSLSNMETLVVGQTSQTILVDQTVSSPSKYGGSREETKTEVSESGIPAFLQACKNESLPADLIELAKSLFARIEEKIQFTLNLGKARKWTAEPNFIAITIQNTNKKFLISVKGNFHDLKSKYSTIEPRQGRGAVYSEFHFDRRAQLSEALDAIFYSARQ